MIEPDIEQKKSDRLAALRKQRERNRAIFAWTTACCVAVALIYTISETKQSQAATDEAIKDRMAELAELSQIGAKRKAAEEQSYHDKRLVLHFLSVCRDVEDIPELTGAQMFAQHRSDSGFALWVPEGSHQLVVTAKLTPNNPSPPALPSAEETDESNSAEDPDAGKEDQFAEQSFEWAVPINGNAGYMFRLDTSRKPDDGAVAWQLTSNDEQIEDRLETVVADGFNRKGWSYTGSDRVAFPNEVERVYKVPFAAVAKQPPAVEVYNLTLRGTYQELPANLTIRAEVRSSGPAQVRPEDAATLVFKSESDLLMPYSGGGRFQLRKPGE